jgi:hypothetical protein
METIGTLVDRLQGLISSSFLIGAFIPVLVFLSVNTAMGYWILPETRMYIGIAMGYASTDPVLFWLGIVLFLFVFALSLWSLNAWFRRMLEGHFMPAAVKDRMVAAQYRKYTRLEEEGEALLDDLSWYRETADSGNADKFYKTILAGARRQGITKPVVDKRKKIPADLQEQYDKLKSKQMQWKRITAQEMQHLFDNVMTELKDNNADGIDSVEKLHTNTIKLFEDAWSKIESMHTALNLKEKSLFPGNLARIGPTQMANFTAVHSEYGISRYGLEIEFFWLRLLKIIKSDSDFYPVLEEAKTQLDFSVTVTVLTGITTFIWVPLTFFAAADFFPYALISATGIPLSAVFYNTASQNYRTFAEAVRSAIDLHRFDLLQALHIELPADSEKERETWIKLYTWPENEDKQKIAYKHSDGNETAEQPKEKISFLNKLKNWFGFK